MTQRQRKSCLSDFIFPANPPVLVHSSPINDKVLLIIRILAALHLTGVYIYDFTILNALLNKFLLLTNVGYFISWLHFVLVVQYRFMPIFKGLDQYAEVLFQTSFCTQWIITVGYWGYLRPTLSTGFTLDFFWSLNAHGIVLFLLMLDFVFNSYRFVFPQFVFFLLICGAYLFLINLPYSLEVKAVYDTALDWKSWQTYIFILSSYLGALLVHSIGRKVYLSCKLPRLRKKIKQFINQNSQQRQIHLINIAQVNTLQNMNIAHNQNNQPTETQNISTKPQVDNTYPQINLGLEQHDEELGNSQIGVMINNNTNINIEDKKNRIQNILNPQSHKKMRRLQQNLQYIQNIQ